MTLTLLSVAIATKAPHKATSYNVKIHPYKVVSSSEQMYPQFTRYGRVGLGGGGDDRNG